MDDNLLAKYKIDLYHEFWDSNPWTENTDTKHVFALIGQLVDRHHEQGFGFVRSKFKEALYNIRVDGRMVFLRK